MKILIWVFIVLIHYCTTVWASTCQINVSWNFTFWYLKDDSWGRLIPEVECWPCDTGVRRFPDVFTPVSEHVVVIIIMNCDLWCVFYFIISYYVHLFVNIPSFETNLKYWSYIVYGCSVTKSLKTMTFKTKGNYEFVNIINIAVPCVKNNNISVLWVSYYKVLKCYYAHS
jgi:hypothetical protein